MSFQSNEALFCVILFILSVCSFTFASHNEITGVTSVTKDNSCYHYIMSALLPLADMDVIDGRQKKTRVKRNGDSGSGAGKFSEAASMGPMKVLQLFFAMIKNIAADEFIGGVHPMSRSVPGPVVKLFKAQIISKLFPNLSPDH